MRKQYTQQFKVKEIWVKINYSEQSYESLGDQPLNLLVEENHPRLSFIQLRLNVEYFGKYS